MNCKRVEELIPLYVGGDIDRRVTAEVQSHLKTCGGCAELAAEYEASRNWLSGASPELDEAMLTDVKRGVMRELRTASSRPGWFELMSAALARALSRPAVAAALLLVVFGALTLWLYLAKPAPPVQVQLTDGGSEQPPRLPDKDEPPGHFKLHRRPTGAGNRHRVTIARSHRGQPGDPASRHVLTQNATAMPEVQPPSAFAVESGGMLRIDIQTGDPNIRIIWFAPKVVDGQQANP